jgi:hypothetical protein
MPYPDLVWTAGGIIGGLLLIDSLTLTPKGKVGIWIIFAAFLFQVYWEITHPWASDTGILQVICVTVILVVGLLYMWARPRAKKGKG